MTAIWKDQTNVFIKYYGEPVDKPTNSTNDQTHVSIKHKIKGIDSHPAIHTTYTHILNDHYYRRLLQILPSTCFYCYDYIASVMDKRINMEQWWNDCGREKPKYCTYRKICPTDATWSTTVRGQ
jgi:hypothetical protein